jgi:nitrogen fixation/metabolism regulation signal transduction histidine kinase
MSVWQTVARKVAHEIKNPLTPIGLVGEQLQIIARQTQDPKLKHILNESSRIIGEETNSLNRMVREFTAFGRLPTPKLQKADLGQLVKDFVERNQNSYDNSVCIQFDGQNYSDSHAHVDSSMIHQILHNLLNNARLAKAPSSVQLKISLSKTDPFWALDVTDDGPGIPPEIQERIFDAYVTTRSTGDKEKGMGLGLTISRQIAVDHGGTLTLHTTSSAGTTIRLCLPVIVITSEKEVAV